VDVWVLNLSGLMSAVMDYFVLLCSVQVIVLDLFCSRVRDC